MTTIVCSVCGAALERRPKERLRDFQKRQSCSTACFVELCRAASQRDHAARRRQPDRIGHIPVGKALWAEVDPQDHERVMRHYWHPRQSTNCDSFYAVAKIDGHNVSLHHFILGCPPRTLIDHKDRDGLNNRRSNIREATHSQNAMNRKRDARNTSGFKGVAWEKGEGKWRAGIKVRGKNSWIGYFDSPEDAARAYDDAARTMFGEFARLNFPGDGEQAA